MKNNFLTFLNAQKVENRQGGKNTGLVDKPRLNLGYVTC